MVLSFKLRQDEERDVTGSVLPVTVAATINTHNNIPNTNGRMLGFSTKENLTHLTAADTIYCDGQSKNVVHSIEQLLNKFDGNLQKIQGTNPTECKVETVYRQHLLGLEKEINNIKSAQKSMTQKMETEVAEIRAAYIKISKQLQKVIADFTVNNENGAVFIRWGRTSCGNSSDLIYTGRKRCYKGWTQEYNGILMSGLYMHKSSSEYSCVDTDAEALPGGSQDQDGVLFYPVRTQCGFLKCPPYSHDTDVPCVVCTK